MAPAAGGRWSHWGCPGTRVPHVYEQMQSSPWVASLRIQHNPLPNVASTHPAHRDLHSWRCPLAALCLIDPAVKSLSAHLPGWELFSISQAGLEVEVAAGRARAAAPTLCWELPKTQSFNCTQPVLHTLERGAGVGPDVPYSSLPTRDILRLRDTLSGEEALPGVGGGGGGHPGTTTRCPTRRGPAGGAAPARGAAGAALLSSRLHFIPCPFSICHTALRAPSQARAARRGLSRRGGVEGGWAEERCLWGGASPPCPRWLRGRRGGGCPCPARGAAPHRPTTPSCSFRCSHGGLPRPAAPPPSPEDLPPRPGCAGAPRARL